MRGLARTCASPGSCAQDGYRMDVVEIDVASRCRQDVVVLIVVLVEEGARMYVEREVR